MTARHQKSPGVWLAADHADLRSLARQHRHFQSFTIHEITFTRARLCRTAYHPNPHITAFSRVHEQPHIYDDSYTEVAGR
jgi:hypothetical protein